MFASFCFAQGAAGKSIVVGTDSFAEGIKAYQKQQYPQAQEQFQEFLKTQPGSPQATVNLAMTLFQLGQKGMALGLLRQVLMDHPQFPVANSAYKFIWDQMPVKEIPHQVYWFENLHQTFLRHLDFLTLVTLTLFVIFAWGWFLISYLAENRRRSAQEQEPLGFPVWLGFLTVVFLFCVGTLTLKVMDQQVLRATYLPEKGSALSAAQENSPALFELSQGLELIVERQENNFYLVTYPGGPSGWILKDTIFIY